MMNCPTCGDVEGEVIWRADAVPVVSNLLCRSRDEALRVPRAPLELRLCPACGLAYNAAFDPEAIVYSQAYENALHFSAQFRRYADDLAQRLVQRHQLQCKRVLEIGCGDASFLTTLCELGHNRGLGMDPAYRPPPEAPEAPEARLAAKRFPGGGARLAAKPLPALPGMLPGAFPGADVQVVAEPFDDRHAGAFEPDLICCRHVLEHLPQPMRLLRHVRHVLADHSGAVPGALPGAVYVEVPNLRYVLQQMGIWDLIYEHCLYFTPESLTRMLERAGFEVLAADDAYGGQFAWAEARPAAKRTPMLADDVLEETERLDQIAQLAAAFSEAYGRRLRRMRSTLQEFAARRQCVVLWGAGSKGVTLLNALESDGAAVAAVVDQNPRKHGCYVVGTAQRIVAPAALRELRPDVVVVMNPVYREEIAAAVADLGIEATLVQA